MSNRLRIPVLLLTALAVGCNDGPSGPEASHLTVQISAPASSEVQVGDELALTATVQGGESFVLWSTSDTAVAGVVGGRVAARRPGSVEIRAQAGADGGSDAITVSVVPRPGGYSAAEVDYFAEIAFGSEFGGAEPLLRRWSGGPRIRVLGGSAVDRATVDSVVAELNELVDITDLSVTAQSAEIDLHLAPQSEFPSILATYVPGNAGFFWVVWNGTQTLLQATVLVATDIDQDFRDHLIREEITQSLGLMRDSFRYPESIFYQGFSLTHGYADIDRAVIELLYRPEMQRGMTAGEAVATARRLVKVETSAADIAAVPAALPARRTGSAGQGGGSGGSGPGR